MVAAPAAAAVARVFIACPGDLADQRGVVSQALATLNHDPEFAGRVELVPYAYENIVPARSGMDPEEVVTSYMLRPEDADLLICMFWRRMGTPLARVINPQTNAPYQSGTEYEYLAAYAAAQTKPTPQILLYRCQRPAPDPATPEERAQLERVNQFFARFGPGGDLLGMVGGFEGDAQLSGLIQRDVAALLRGGLLAQFERRDTGRGDGPVVFGLPALPAGFVPRPESLDTLRKTLLGSRPQVGVVAAAALHGLGGLGKTVLARAAWEDPAIRAAFPDGALWATVGQTPDIARIQREWIRVLGGDIALAASPETGRAELTRLARDRAMLLVLDDIWQARAAKALEVAGPRVRVLITTRDATQAAGATPVSLSLMTLEECRQTLRDAAGGRGPDDATLDAIAGRVGRLPLALKVIGGLLALELTWPEIAAELDAGRFQDIAVGDSSIFVTLDASVRLLPADQQDRYRELAVFPRDTPLNPAAVARLWARTGGVTSFVARKLLGELRARSLVQADYTLHDVQADYLRAVMTPAERVRALHSALCDAYAAAPDPAGDASPWSALPEDDDLYGWRFIATHLHQAGRDAELEALLTDMTYLEGKIARLGVAAAVADLGLLSEAGPLQLAASVLRAGALTLARHPEELLNQVHGRAGPIPALHHAPARPRPYFALYTASLKPADPALVRILAGHTGGVNGCAFSPDGTLALSASWDRTLRLWEVATGKTLAIWYGEAGCLCCAFSPLGDRAMAGDGVGGTHLFMLVGGERRGGPEPPPAPPVSFAGSREAPGAGAPEPESKPRRKRFWFF